MSYTSTNLSNNLFYTNERDALRFHWTTNNGKLRILRFTRVLFGLVSSPFRLWRVIASHLERWKHERPDDVEELERCLYVDVIINGRESVERRKLGKKQQPSFSKTQPSNSINGRFERRCT